MKRNGVHAGMVGKSVKWDLALRWVDATWVSARLAGRAKEAAMKVRELLFLLEREDPDAEVYLIQRVKGG